VSLRSNWKTFRDLMLIVFAAGASAGLIQFTIQHFTVVPLIEDAERYERVAERTSTEETHEGEGWHPAEGWQRTSLTAAATVFTGIGLAALLIGAIVLSGRTPSVRIGVLFALAGFATLHLAPALGLPPRPPGTAVPDLYDAQLWWAGTAITTGAGIWMLCGSMRTSLSRIGGIICLLLPHLAGAPGAIGTDVVPEGLSRQFAIASLLTTGLFWVLLGTFSGFLLTRSHTQAGKTRAGSFVSL
jgi:cobalt transporter subunit CbtA